MKYEDPGSDFEDDEDFGAIPSASRDGKGKRARVSIACDFCIKRKIKCSTKDSSANDFGETPCDQCKSRNRECTYRTNRPPGVRLPALWAKIVELERELQEAKSNRTPNSGDSASGESNSVDENGGAGLSVDQPVEPFPFPDTVAFNALISLYKLEVGPLMYHNPFPGTEGFEREEPSALVRMGMACLASRYLSHDPASGVAIYERARKMLEPTLAGNVQPTVETIHALMLIVTFLCVSSDFKVGLLCTLAENLGPQDSSCVDRRLGGRFSRRPQLHQLQGRDC
jgi:hypothetical protein